MDRAGIAGDDGQTHHGGLDIAYMLAVPGMTIAAPHNADELIGLLKLALEWKHGPFAIRIPRDNVPALPRPIAEIEPVVHGAGRRCAPARTSRSWRWGRWWPPR
jgi:1-deoxy-D-xylulose-5-phosphate synthase